MKGSGLVFLLLLLINTQDLWSSIWGLKLFSPKSIFAMSQGQNDLVANVQLAIEHHKNGNTEEAILQYEKVLPKLVGKTKASLSGNVGALYMSKGEYELAKGHFLASVEADPDNASAHFNLAVVLTTKLGEHAKAIKHCGKAMKLDPGNHKALHLMGNIMQSIGRPEDATKYFVAAENIALQAQEEATVVRGAGEASSKYPLQKLAVYSAKVGDVLKSAHSGREYAVKCVSVSPLVFVIDDLIDESESEHIIGRASKLLEKSFVMGGEYDVSAQGGAEPLVPDLQDDEAEAVDPALYRSSYNAWLSQDSALNDLQRRLAAVLGLPAPYLQHKSEELQVVRYGPGGQFKVHQDSSAFSPRLVTALLYLNTVNEGEEEEEEGASCRVQGGETWFPYAPSANTAHGAASAEKENTRALTSPDTVEGAIAAALNEYEAHSASVAAEDAAASAHSEPDATNSDASVCLPGLKVVPKRGRAVVFFNHLASGAIDPRAVHAGLPVRVSAQEGGETSSSGVKKWVANYWVELDGDLLSQYLN